MQFETIKRVKNNQVTFGAWVYLKDPAVTEMIADAGFDWVIIDLEHGNLNEDLAQALMVPLKGTKCVPIVRIVSLDSDLIKKVLDTGALGIMVPQVQSADDAKSVVRAVRYSPQGARGMGYGRANGWGQRAKSYYQDANDSTLVVLTVESKQGVDNIDEIVAVPGVDVIFPGTYDLSGSLGVPGQFGHPLVVDAKKKMMQACSRRNMNMGDDGDTQEAIRAKLSQGAHFLALTVDTDLIWQGAEKMLRAAREIDASC